VRLLPYSLVPGLLLSSPIFLKAVSVIAKQQHHSQVTATATTSKGKKMDKSGYSGMFSSFYIQVHALIRLKINSLDPLNKFLKGSEVDLVARARDVITNSIMSEIAKDDPQGHAEYQDAVRHQIVAFYQRLRLSLLVLDNLIEAYNAPN
jgi:hypothetical protein